MSVDAFVREETRRLDSSDLFLDIFVPGAQYRLLDPARDAAAEPSPVQVSCDWWRAVT